MWAIFFLSDLLARKNNNNITQKKNNKGFKKMQINLTIGVTLRKIKSYFQQVLFIITGIFRRKRS